MPPREPLCPAQLRQKRSGQALVLVRLWPLSAAKPAKRKRLAIHYPPKEHNFGVRLNETMRLGYDVLHTQPNSLSRKGQEHTSDSGELGHEVAASDPAAASAVPKAQCTSRLYRDPGARPCPATQGIEWRYAENLHGAPRPHGWPKSEAGTVCMCACVHVCVCSAGDI